MKIFSTLSNDKSFPLYGEKKEGSGLIKKSAHKTAILIKGGAKLQDRNQIKEAKSDYAVTELTADQYKEIKDNPAFKRMIERGFFTVDKAPSSPKKDKSSPLSVESVKKNPMTSKAKTTDNKETD